MTKKQKCYRTVKRLIQHHIIVFEGLCGIHFMAYDRPAKDKLYYAKRKVRPTYKRNNRADNLRNKYGITVEQYDSILSFQNGVCAICKRPPGVKRLSVDHDHKTCAVRGLLCQPCNIFIGHADEDENRLLNAVQYLRKLVNV